MSARGAFEPGAGGQGILPTRAVEKVWGRRELPEPFASEVRGRVAEGEPVGEIWFASPAELDDILVKYLFTSDKLSVQVHPSDVQAHDGEDGKEECWLILDADPDAKLAIGFKQELSADAMREAALDGSIEDLLEWHSVQAGDFFYLPAGTVHAIGAGISLVEVQQSSDTTFRLYDYGRPRDLHLERAIAVADRGSYSAAYRSRVPDQTCALVGGPHFQLTRMIGSPDPALTDQFARPCMVLPLEGEVSLNGSPVSAGSCAYAGSLSAFRFREEAVALLVASAS
ncbi:class I mannose-6-phosphate isomerase [Altererythrobacter lutimaris]|uniref:Class I mannose-6-phosphate isomerase n=1 Tax=Altererythrobacter lutimaris TaxID=2743979 RepID=A0A850HD13_9SPHN|nr:class I mannose-6-phosphate isomerase [Altererythrobacter lutimaris]NVE95669.1 class I mannose-6-phosphate isomerase [Altererythrobacter lutimaris]